MKAYKFWISNTQIADQAPQSKRAKGAEGAQILFLVNQPLSGVKGEQALQSIYKAFIIFKGPVGTKRPKDLLKLKTINNK